MILSSRQLAARAATLAALTPDLAALASFSDAKYPTLASVAFLAPFLSGLGLDAHTLTSDLSAATLIEASDGNWEQVMDSLAASVMPGLEGRAAAFDAHIAPSAECTSTRTKAMAGWRTVVSWALSRKALHLVLPMSYDTLKAVLWDLLSLGCSHAVVKGVVDAILARHRRFRMTPPLSGDRAYGRLMQSLGRFQGQQRPLKLPVTRDLVVSALLALPGRSPAQQRDCLALVVATLTGLRPAEGARLQSCDFQENFDARHGAAYRGSAALNIMCRKNDQNRKGHHPRIGRAMDPGLDVVSIVAAYARLLGIGAQDGCTKAARPHARCPVCFPLFPLFKRVSGGSHVASKAPPSASAFSGMIMSGLELAGADKSQYSGVSARRGCITTATEAGVPEEVLWLQSGHAGGSSSRRYVNLSDPALLFQTWAAFRL